MNYASPIFFLVVECLHTHTVAVIINGTTFAFLNTWLRKDKIRPVLYRKTKRKYISQRKYN